MNTRQETYFHGLILALLIIGFGLFITFGTFGALAVVGIPIILYGFYVGFMELRAGARGRNWYGRRRKDAPAITE